MAEATKLYRANWQICGLAEKDLFKDDTIKLTEEKAAPLVAVGALSAADGKPEAAPAPVPGEPASAVASDAPSILDTVQSATA